MDQRIGWVLSDHSSWLNASSTLQSNHSGLLTTPQICKLFHDDLELFLLPGTFSTQGSLLQSSLLHWKKPLQLTPAIFFQHFTLFYCFLNPLDSLKWLLIHSTVHFSLFWLHCGAYGVLVPWLKVKPVLPVMEVQSPNRWATRAFPCGCCWVTKSCLTLLLCGLALQAPLSVEFPRQKYWSRLPFPSSGDLPDPGMEPEFPVLQANFFTTESPEKARECPTSSLILCLSHLPHKVYESKTFACPVRHSIPTFWKRSWYFIGIKSTWQGTDDLGGISNNEQLWLISPSSWTSFPHL